MLLPSPISLDVDRRAPSSNCLHTSLSSLVSPPTSPLSQTSNSTFSSIFSTCRALQSMLATPTQLPPTPFASPVILEAPAPISKPNLRMRSMRSRKTNVEIDSDALSPTTTTNMKVAKRSMVIRGHKRRRSISDDGLKHTTNNRASADALVEGNSQSLNDDSIMQDLPSTPKRSRIAPEAIPFGLARSDYHDLHLKSMSSSSKQSPSTPSKIDKQPNFAPSTPPPPFPFTFTSRSISSSSFNSISTSNSSALVPSSSTTRSSSPSPFNKYKEHSNSSALVPSSNTTRSSSPSPFNKYKEHAASISELNSEVGKSETVAEDIWNVEDDKMLIELVLEKLKLSKSELEECAKSLGKESGSVGKRWKSLMAGGSIGLKEKNGRKRSKIPETWR